MPVRSDIDNLQYPYLRPFMIDICTEALRSNTLQAQRTKVTTILIHKKGDPSLPKNFKPIFLEPVSLKTFTFLLRNTVFIYLTNNQFIESHHRKGFMPGMSGTFEHKAEMSHINHSRKQQWSVTITLLDLEIVFGEVQHSLIQSVLRYHHIRRPSKLPEFGGIFPHFSSVTASRPYF